MAVRREDHEVFRRIGEAEAMRWPAPASFSEAVVTLSRLIARRRSMFPDREFEPTDDEFCAHEALYARARALGCTEPDPTLGYFQALFTRLGIKWCVAGAVAANAYRAPRDTTDLDLVVQIAAERYASVAQSLQADGWRVFRVSPASDYPDVVRLQHAEHFPTDLLLVKTAYQAEALRRARTTPSGTKVLAPEDVIIHKLIAYRHRDRADISEILRSGTPLDGNYIERWAREWDVLKRWQDAVTESVA